MSLGMTQRIDSLW